MAELGLTQSQLGEKLGVIRQTISVYKKKGLNDLILINKINKLLQEKRTDPNTQSANKPQIITNQVQEDQMNDREIIRELNMLLFKKEKEIEHLKRELKVCQEADRVHSL